VSGDQLQAIEEEDENEPPAKVSCFESTPWPIKCDNILITLPDPKQSALFYPSVAEPLRHGGIYLPYF